ncbi:MAG TPA: ATP-binding protein [Ktedonobacterales bacterium]|jgi:signal transduction histidine kinase|nr:ATP-binding protein [Ktedonobacterales bacterium]
MSAFDAFASNPFTLGLAVAFGMFLFLAALAALTARVGGRGRLVAIRDDAGSYALLFVLVVLVVVAAALAAQWLAASHAAFASTVFIAWLCGLVVASFVPLNAMVRRAADQLLYGDHYEFDATLQRFSQHLAALRTQEEVVSYLLDGLADTMNLAGIAYVSLPEGLDLRVLQLVESDDLLARRNFATSRGRAAVRDGLASLDLKSHPLSWDAPMLVNPWPGCRALVLVGPRADTDSAGLLVVGAKRGGHRLRSTDRALLLTVAHQTATALSNALLVQGLHISLRQVQISTSQLLSARAELQLLLRQLVSAEERQRASLARDLHDDALQDVLYVMRHAQLCTRFAAALEASDGNESPPPMVGRLIEELRQVADRSQVVEQKLRALCLGLYPQLLRSFGLTAAMEDLADQMRVATELEILVECDDDVTAVANALPDETAVHIYRIVQEALTNAGKHGMARSARVQLHLRQGRQPLESLESTKAIALVVEIHDDGVGLQVPVDFGALLREGHLGLAGMRERAEQIGATLEFQRALQGGLNLVLAVPLSGEEPVRTAEVQVGSVPVDA